MHSQLCATILNNSNSMSDQSLITVLHQNQTHFGCYLIAVILAEMKFHSKR